MTMMTLDELRAIMPRLSPAKGEALFPPLVAAMTEFAIEAPARAAAFLAQLAHESGQFRFMEELWGPTPAQIRYEPASTLATALGNTQAGDGHRFKGRGPIQITGRANYRRFGDLLEVDLVTAPERAASSELAFRIAGLFWSKKGLNELADQGTPEAFREIKRRINGGFNGLAERQQFYAAARAALAVTGPAVSRGALPVQPLPRDAEPVFERGYEAIVVAGPERRTRKAPARKRARQAAPVKTHQAARASSSRKAASVKRKLKAAPHRRARKKKSKRSGT
jgi:putative chitinase